VDFIPAEIGAQKPTLPVTAQGDSYLNLNALDTHDREFNSLWWYALIGILCLLPGFALLAAVYVMAKVLSSSWESGVAWIVLGLLGIAWTSSGVSGWVCGRFLARRKGIAFLASLFYANSTGWICLVLALPGFEFFDSASAWLAYPFPVYLFMCWLSAIISLPSLFISGIGLLITWGIMKNARRRVAGGG
jgi:hypothetical protein